MTATDHASLRSDDKLTTTYPREDVGGCRGPARRAGCGSSRAFRRSSADLHAETLRGWFSPNTRVVFACASARFRWR